MFYERQFGRASPKRQHQRLDVRACCTHRWGPPVPLPHASLLLTPLTPAAPLPSMHVAQQLQQAVAAIGSHCNMRNTLDLLLKHRNETITTYVR